MALTSGTDARFSIAESSPSWAKSTLLENYALTLGTNLTKTADTGKNTPDSVEGTKGEQRHQVAAAAKTTKLEIKEYVRQASSSFIANKPWL